MSSIVKSLLATTAGLTMAVGLLSAPATAVSEAVSVTASVTASATSLAGSSLSGFDTQKTLYATITTSAGTLTRNDLGSGAEIRGNSNSVTTLLLHGTQDQLNQSLQNEIVITAPCKGDMTISINVSEYSGFRNPANGHYYALSADPYNLADAITYAESLPLSQGGTNTFGYLATITSAEENEFIRSTLPNLKFGASDYLVEGEWRWVGGPEKNQLFWLGDIEGSAQNEMYNGWAGGEPNNSGDEDTAQMYGDGVWNDAGDGGDFWVIEWGGMPGDDLGAIENFEDSAEVSITGAINGMGTEESPFLVSNATELSSVSSCAARGVYFRQDADITVSNFEGIGSNDKPFLGHYDGNSRTITETGATHQNVSRRGLFNVVGNSEGDRETTSISNLNLNSTATVTDSNQIGLLAGRAENAEISDVTVSGQITLTSTNESAAVVGSAYQIDLLRVVSNADIEITNNSYNTGGLLGNGTYVWITDSSNTGDITSSGDGNYMEAVGGLAGTLNSGYLVGNSNTGDISLPLSEGWSIGGLIGRLWNMNLSESYSSGQVNAPSFNLVGGLTGAFYYGQLYESYSAGSVVGNEGVGGLVGESSEADITNTFSSASVTSANAGGALIGRAECNNVSKSYAYGKVVAQNTKGLFGSGCGTIQEAFWVQPLVEVPADVSQVGSELPITVEQAKDIATYLSANWDISNSAGTQSVWVICEGENGDFPALRMQAAYCLPELTHADEPVIFGLGTPGSELTLNMGTWVQGVTFTYVWKADGKPIPNATQEKFTPSSALTGKTITVAVTGSLTNWKSATRNSANFVVVSGKGVDTSWVKRSTARAIDGFSPDSWEAPAGFNSKIAGLVRGHSQATSVMCIGVTKYGANKTKGRSVGYMRAKVACAQILKLMPGVRISYGWKVAAKGDTVQRGVAIRFNK